MVCWEDVIKHIRQDIAYIWSTEVKKDFKAIKQEAKKIEHILKKLSEQYQPNNLWHVNKINDIEKFLNHLAKVQAKKEWVKIAYAELCQVIADIEKEKQVLMLVDKKEQLLEWGFNIGSHPKLADFLMRHWNDTVEIAILVRGNTKRLFQSNLPKLKDVINEKTWQGIIEMARRDGIKAAKLFDDGLPAIKDAINEKTWQGIIEMARVSNGRIWFLFSYGLSKVGDIINEKTWPGMIKIVQKTPHFAPYIFNELPNLKNIINEKTWPLLVKGLPEIANAVGDQSLSIFQFGLRSVKHLINEKTWPLLVKGLIDISHSVGKNMGAFRSGLLSLINPKRLEEDLQIIVVFFKQIGGSQKKLRLLDLFLRNIPKSVLRTFKDFIFLVLENQPNQLLNILRNIRFLYHLKAQIKDEILSFASVVRTFRLRPREYPSERVKKQIQDTYIFLTPETTNQEDKKKKLIKLIQKLSDPNYEIRQTAIRKIIIIITPLIISYLENITKAQIKEKWQEFAGAIPNKGIIYKYFEDVSFTLAIAITNDRPEAKLLLKEIGSGNFWPEKKIPNCFPYDNSKSQSFIKKMEGKGINMEPWIYGFEKNLPVGTKSSEKHKAQLIEQNIEEVLEHFKELGIETSPEKIGEAFQQIKNHKNQKIVQDIKQHIQIIKSLRGAQQSVSRINKARVYLELNPLKALQMGQKVMGSCLALDGGHCEETITNIVDINKRVAWAEHKGEILGRILLAMNNDGEILRYKTYYAFTGIDLDTPFDMFAQKLSEACNTKLSKKEKVSLIIAKHWYPGSSPE